MLATPSFAQASELSWSVLPVRADNPPPRDPTLMRLSRAIAGALDEIVPGTVAVTKRAMRDEACPSPDGKCPRDVATLVGADRVISLILAPGYKHLTIRLYSAEAGLRRTGKLPCRWSLGMAVCDTRKLDEAVAETKNEGGEEAVKRAFDELEPKLTGCNKKGYGELTAPELPDNMDVTFRLNSRGRAIDVRLDPTGYDKVPAFACMARTLESLKLPKTVKPPDHPQRFRLPY